MVPSRDVWSRLVVAATACTIVFLVGLHSNTPARVQRAYGGRDSARQRMAVDFFVPPRSGSGTPPSPLRQRRCSSRRRLLPATLASKADSTPSPLSSTKSSSTAVEGETGKNQREAQGAAKAAPPLRPVRNEAYHAMRWELSQRISLESPRLVKCIFQTGPHAYVARIGSKESTTGTSAKFTSADQDPVQIMAELSDGKQPLLFLPGVDGSASTLRFQHEDLTRNYDVWVEFVDPQDRSSFADRVAITSNLVRNLQTSTEMNMMEKKENPKASSDARPLIMGESFGGLHALGVGLECGSKHLSKAVLINPASSYDRTPWRTIGEGLSQLPEELYYPAGVAALMATVPDEWQANAFLDAVGARKLIPGGGKQSGSANDEAATSMQPIDFMLNLAQTGDGLIQGLGMLNKVVDMLPSATLEHRLKNWLQQGCADVNPRLSRNFGIPTLVIAGSGDRMIPSEEEATRLRQTLGGLLCTTRVLKNTGHAALDPRLNMTREIEMWGRKMSMPPKDPIKDFVMPSMEVRENATAYVQTIRQLAAPAFFSTNKDGKIDPGVGNVPLPSDSAVGGTMTNDDVGVLLVGNHQLYGLDLGVIITQFLEDRESLLRGLAHPLVARGAAMAGIGMGTGAGDGEGDPFGGPANIFKQFGAVPVSGRNLDTLMRERKPSLLFPGGVREVYHKKGEDYKVIWPEKGEFVRAAAKHNATIVPFSAIGIADSFRMVADSNDILNAPIVGDYVQQRASLLPKARDNETFVAPLSIPQLPARFYFLFGKPVETFNLDYKDKEECQRVYESIRRDVEVGIDMLLAERDKDPFREYPARLFYETVNQKPAPLPDLFTNKDKE